MDLQQFIRQEAERCVACGLCVPLCPTYRLLQTESESPRGRIALIQALASGSLAPERRALDHLDHCLTCRACERACPSGVRYGDLLDATRALLAHEHGQRLRAVPRFLLSRLTRGGPASARRLAWVLRLYTRRGIRDFLRATGLTKLLGLTPLEAVMPGIEAPIRLPCEALPAQTPRARVELFPGCVSGVVDREALHAAVTLLTRLGFEAGIPETQGCCGAFAWHRGERDEALPLMHKNVNAFAGNNDTLILSGVSACTAFLQDYARHLDQPQAQSLGRRTQDLTRFLAEQPLHRLPLKSLPQRVAVHEPCLHRNVLRSERDLYTLVQAIPQIEAVPLAGNDLCCGAAGDYFLREPALAGQLAQQKLAALRESGARILVTSNVGCALHLKAALSAAGLAVEVLHPVTLLARQLARRS